MKNSAILRVFGAIILAVIAGCFTGRDTAIFEINLLQLYGVVGQTFLNALKLIAVPLVSSSIIIATARMGSDSAFKVLGFKSFGYFISTTVLAMLVGYFCVTILQPGIGQDGSVGQSYISAEQLKVMQSEADQGVFEKIELILLRMVPSNIVQAAAEGQILGLIVFCSFFGFLSAKIDPHASATVLSFFQGVFEIMMKITHLLMKVLPVGVFALIAKVIASTGLDAIASAIAFFGVVLLGLSITCGVVFPVFLKIIGKKNPFQHFRAMFPALMPVAIECLEEGAGIPSRICNFFVPLATAINMPGTALHVCVAVFFIAQVYGVSLGFATQGMILLMTLLTSFGVAGVPSGSLFAIVTVMTMIGLPSEGIVLILVVERLLDMCRTAANVYANSCCAVLIAQAERQFKENNNVDVVPIQVQAS